MTETDPEHEARALVQNVSSGAFRDLLQANIADALRAAAARLFGPTTSR